MSSDAALKLVACQVAVSSPKLKAMLSGKDVYQYGGLHIGSSQNAFSNLPTYSCNCIGEVVRLSSRTDQIYFGIIKRYDEYSRKHSIMFEDGTVKFLDMSKEDWEFACYLVKTLSRLGSSSVVCCVVSCEYHIGLADPIRELVVELSLAFVVCMRGNKTFVLCMRGYKTAHAGILFAIRIRAEFRAKLFFVQ
ncbi:hypothetical protein OIU77_015257 [Salix suchowensis]|uniref:Uncharacterized protein n=1 Tax=Salix suchowensis TaxID=1278906 RepID=A0ABQ8ZTP8_9ROSI|nr:hypothetical protein OIU77_015257 [Salix suchowensis]